MSKISVVMPVYNTKEEWLREAIESILNQTYKDFEFIIIDDGSDVPIEPIVNSYDDDRIVFVRQNNKGIARSLNYGFKIAKGEYIARMDADDISMPERFEKQVAFLNNNPNVSVLGTWFEYFPEKSIVKHPQKPKYLDFMKNCCIAHPSIMLRKSDFEQFNLSYDYNYKCEDYELWSRAVRVLNFENLQDVLLKYRIHSSNASKPCADFDADVAKVQQNMLDFLSNDSKEKEKLIKFIYLRDNYVIIFLKRIKRKIEKIIKGVLHG